MCLYCGEYIDADCGRGSVWNIEHIVPLSIVKWSGAFNASMSKRDLVDALNSEGNLCLVHIKCNDRKGCTLSPEDVSSKCYANSELVYDYKSVYESVKDDVLKYNSFTDRVLCEQGNKCYCCGLPIWYGVIRRLDSTQPRIASNAVIVCNKCNKNFGYIHKRHVY